MENKTCYSCKNFKLFTIKEMKQAFKMYEEVKEISADKMVFIGRCKFFSKYPSWSRYQKYGRRKTLNQSDIVKTRDRECVHYKHSRNDYEAQMEFCRRWDKARMVLVENSQEPAEITLAELKKSQLRRIFIVKVTGNGSTNALKTILDYHYHQKK